MKRAAIAILASAAMLAPTVTLAHPGHGDTTGFVHGIAHPFSGIDHVLALVAVGMLAAKYGGRALWLLPVMFSTVMALAAALGMAGLQFPSLEIGIAISLVAFGLAVAHPSKLPSAVSVGLAALFAAFHGYAHGAEMPAGTSGLAYAAGLVTGTALLIGMCTGVTLLVGLKGGQLGPRVLRGGGAAIGLYGIAVLSGAL